MQVTPVVSGIIPTFQMARYVCDSIGSATRQSLSELEVIVIDDGSEDGTDQAIAPLLSDARIRYIKTPHAGRSAATNRGLQMARGKFIAFLDADDVWLPDKLATQVSALERIGRHALAYSRHQRMSADGVPLAVYDVTQHSGLVTEALVVKNFVPFSSVVVPATVLKLVGEFNENLRMGMDWDWLLRASVTVEFVPIPDVTYLYRVWDGQLSANWALRSENKFAILTAFLAAFPGVVDPRTVRKARAQAYLSRGRERANREAQFLRAIRDCVIGIAHGGDFLFAAKTIGLCSARLLARSKRPLDA